MNLITNRCLGGYIYRDILKEQYENPFIWTGIWDQYFNKLFSEYGKINFNNFSVEHDPEERIEKYFIIIDNKIRVNYGHVLLDPKASTPVPRDVNIYTADPVGYLRQKYKERLSRMTKEPVWIYLDLDFTHNYEIAEIAKKQKRKIGILTVDKDFPRNDYTNNQLVVHQDWKKVQWWKYLQANHLKEVNALLK